MGVQRVGSSEWALEQGGLGGRPASGRSAAFQSLLQEVAAASLAGTSSGLGGAGSFSWGDWREVDGKKVRQALPPGNLARAGAPLYYADAEGNWYVQTLRPGARLTAASRPSWAPEELPGTAPVENVSPVPSKGWQWGEWRTVNGQELREVLAPEALRRDGKHFFMDEEGQWWRGVEDAGGKMTLKTTEVPRWFSGWSPEVSKGSDGMWSDDIELQEFLAKLKQFMAALEKRFEGLGELDRPHSVSKA